MFQKIKNLPFGLLLIIGVFASNTLHAAPPAINITSPSTTAIVVESDDQAINITGNGNLIGTAACEDDDGCFTTALIMNDIYAGTTITVDTTSSSDGISTTDSSPAIIITNGSGFSLTLNSGTISSSSTSPFLHGTLSFGSAGGNSSVTIGQDSGGLATISNSTYGSAISAFTFNVDSTLNIDNKATGTLSSLSDSEEALSTISLVDFDGGSSFTFSNAGILTAGSSSNYAMTMFGFSGSVTNSGTIIGAITSVVSDSLNVINNSGTIIGNITLGSNSSSSVTINGGSVTGNITMANAGQNVTLNGGVLNGIISGTGSFVVNSGSSLGLTVTDASATLIALTGAATISANTTLNVTLPVGIASGTTITLLDASLASSISTIADSNVNINGSGGNAYGVNIFSAEVSGNKLLLTVTAAPAPVLTSSNDQSTYNAIVSATTATGALNSVQTYLSSSSNSSAQKEEVIKSVTAQVDNSTNRVAFNTANISANIVSARLESLRTSHTDASIIDTSFVNNLFGQPALAQTLEPLRDNNIKPSHPLSLALNGDEEFSKSMWIQTFATAVKQGNTSSGDGFNSNSGGVLIGADAKISADLVLGVSTGYSKSNVNARNSSKNIAVDTYQASIYSGYNAQSFFLNTTLGMALNEYSSNRYIDVAGVEAEAKYSGQGYNARIEIGSNYHFPNEVLFTPSFMITAARNVVNAYDESGAGTLDLHVGSNSSNFFEARTGAEVSRLFTTTSGTKFRPQFSASYGYDFAGDTQVTTSNFIGQNTSFTSNGGKVEQGSLKVGTGVSFYSKNDITLSLNYGLEYRKDYIANSGWARFRYGF